MGRRWRSRDAWGVWFAESRMLIYGLSRIALRAPEGVGTLGCSALYWQKDSRPSVVATEIWPRSKSTSSERPGCGTPKPQPVGLCHSPSGSRGLDDGVRLGATTRNYLTSVSCNSYRRPERRHMQCRPRRISLVAPLCVLRIAEQAECEPPHGASS